ncbi:MAG: transposase [Planctomycetota bacterium]
MKDGRAHLAYKAQHAVDVDTEIVVAATIHHADRPDSEVMKEAIVETNGVMFSAGADEQFHEVIADKGYHKAETLAWLSGEGSRSYIPRSARRRAAVDRQASRLAPGGELNRRRVADSRSSERSDCG